MADDFGRQTDGDVTRGHEPGFVAAGLGPRFSPGQDVHLLVPDDAPEAEDRTLAIVGTVTGAERQEDGSFAYTVHFPGKAGVRHGLAASSLEEYQSPAVLLPNGALSVKDAEEYIVSARARHLIHPDGAGEFIRSLPVAVRLAHACDMDVRELGDQLDRKAGQRVRELRAGHRASPAALAAKDLVPGAVPLQEPEPGQAAAPPASAPRPNRAKP